MVRSRSRRADIAHHTFYLPGWRTAEQQPSVVTVYDMIPEILGHGDQSHFAKRQYVFDAAAVICISHATAEALLECYGRRVPTVSVVHLAVGEHFTAPPPEYHRDPDLVLFVGKRQGYKNFSILLKALQIAGRSLRDVRVCCVGGERMTSSQYDEIAKAGIASRVQFVSATDSQLAALYWRASVLVYPSQNEGFGLPIVEAMASGCPVIASDIPASREIGGDVVQLTKPGAPDELAAAMECLLSRSVDELDQRAARGIVRARQFTKDRMLSETASVYRKIAPDCAF